MFIYLLFQQSSNYTKNRSQINLCYTTKDNNLVRQQILQFDELFYRTYNPKMIQSQNKRFSSCQTGTFIDKRRQTSIYSFPHVKYEQEKNEVHDALSIKYKIKSISQRVQKFVYLVCSNITYQAFQALTLSKYSIQQIYLFFARNLVFNKQHLIQQVLKQNKFFQKQSLELIQDILLNVERHAYEYLIDLTNEYLINSSKSPLIFQKLAKLVVEKQQSYDFLLIKDIRLQHFIKRSYKDRIQNSYDSYLPFVQETIKLLMSSKNQSPLSQQKLTIPNTNRKFIQILLYLSQQEQFKPFTHQLSYALGNNKKELFLDLAGIFSLVFCTERQRKFDNDRQSVSRLFQDILIGYPSQYLQRRINNKKTIAVEIDINLFKFYGEWASSLEEIFNKPQQHIKSKQNIFKNTQNQIVILVQQSTQQLVKNLKLQNTEVQKQLSILKQRLRYVESYIFLEDSSVNLSQIYISIMQRYLCVLIHHLIVAGSTIKIGAKQANINLVNFSIPMAKSIHFCSQSTFIAIVNTLTSLQKQSSMKDKFMITKIKHNQENNSLTIGYVLFKKMYFEIEIIKQSHERQNNCRIFKHLLTSLAKAKFGIVSELSLITSDFQQLHKKPKQNERNSWLAQIQKSTPISLQKIQNKHPIVFACPKCRKLVVNDNIQLFKNSIYCNKCCLKQANPFRFMNHEIAANDHFKLLKTSRIQDVMKLQGGQFLLQINVKARQYRNILKIKRVYLDTESNKRYLVQISPIILKKQLTIASLKQQALHYQQQGDFVFFAIDQGYLDEIHKKSNKRYKDRIQQIDKIFQQSSNQKLELKTSNSMKSISSPHLLTPLDKQWLCRRANQHEQQTPPNDTKKDISLNLESSKLKTFGVNNYPNLKYLNISNNKIQKISLANNPNLIYLQASGNNFKQIFLQNNNLIQQLSLSSCKLQSIKLQSNTKLRKLSLRNNQLKQINLNKNKSLVELDLSYNRITKINVFEFINLKCLNLQCNEIASIDTSSNLYLKFLNLSENIIKKIDLLKNEDLTYLNIQRNSIAFINLQNNLKLNYLNISHNAFKEIDVQNNLQLSIFKAQGNKLQSINLSKNRELAVLDARKNSLKFVDLSNNSSLSFLCLNCNKLQAIDVTANLNLTYLDLFNNKIKQLDLLKNYKLQHIDIRQNHLEYVGIISSKSLKYFHLQDQSNDQTLVQMYSHQQHPVSPLLSDKSPKDPIYRTLITEDLDESNKISQLVSSNQSLSQRLADQEMFAKYFLQNMKYDKALERSLACLQMEELLKGKKSKEAFERRKVIIELLQLKKDNQRIFKFLEQSLSIASNQEQKVFIYLKLGLIYLQLNREKQLTVNCRSIITLLSQNQKLSEKYIDLIRNLADHLFKYQKYQLASKLYQKILSSQKFKQQADKKEIQERAKKCDPPKQKQESNKKINP